MRLAGVVLIPLLVMCMQPALAAHCTTYSTNTTDLEAGVIVVTVDPVVLHTIPYIVYDACQPGCILSYWVYDESNGLPGLQREDAIHADTCHDMIDPDTIAA